MPGWSIKFLLQVRVSRPFSGKDRYVAEEWELQNRGIFMPLTFTCHRAHSWFMGLIETLELLRPSSSCDSAGTTKRRAPMIVHRLRYHVKIPCERFVAKDNTISDPNVDTASPYGKSDTNPCRQSPASLADPVSSKSQCSKARTI